MGLGFISDFAYVTGRIVNYEGDESIADKMLDEITERI